MAAADAWISLGGNQGNTRALFREVPVRLGTQAGLSAIAQSSLYRTPPWGDEDQPPFLNAVLRLKSDLDARSLFGVLEVLERDLGRERNPDRRWGPRCIDLDLLMFGRQVMSSPALTIPHPRLHERAFVLVPLEELSPGLSIPGYGPVSERLAALDRSGIETVCGPGWAD
ncbi:MAG: 2-amino-4-hydroxy-6-hydroxymethyldihydropteridine diphosphokinase [Xanthomonadales bacterium]|nr:2-amino-4-hydroxy-6-hydroxymethyldihydropteridine diphosphokinase [Xanthomonadales bacterium]